MPEEFLDGKSILVTTAKMLFNGMTKFGISPRSTTISTVILDDAHACLDVIRECFVMRFNSGTQAYADLISYLPMLLQTKEAAHSTKYDPKKVRPFSLCPIGSGTTSILK